MQLNLVQFLGQLMRSEGTVSTAGGIATFDDGATFDVGSSVQSLQTLLSCASHDLNHAAGQMKQFSETQPGDKPFYQDTRAGLNEIREGLKAIVNAEVTLPDGSEAMKVSLDGGVTFRPAPQGVRIIYGEEAIPGEDDTGVLQINACPERLICDVWTTREEFMDHNIGSKSFSVYDFIDGLMKDNE